MHKPKKRWLGLLLLIPVLLLVLTSCGTDERGLGDAPIGNAYEAPRDIIVMPDQFPNLAVMCDLTTRIYVTTREAPPIAVPDHPACEGNDETLQEQGRQIDGEEFEESQEE